MAGALANRAENIVTFVSHTTRPQRPGETDGVDYFYVDPAQFEQMVRDDRFLEHAKVFGHCYGTSRHAVEKAIKSNQSVLLDIDWQGAQQVGAAFKEAVSVYILPPSVEILAQRLADRGRETPEQISVRLDEAASEMSHYREYDHILVNTEFDKALEELEALIHRGEPPHSGRGFDVAALVDSAKSVRLKTSESAIL